MALLSKKSSFFFTFIVSALFLHATEPVLNSSSVQNWETETIDSVISLDIDKTGLRLPSDRNESFYIIERYIPSRLKNIYLSIIVDSSHRLGNYLAEQKVDLNSLNAVIEKGKRTPPYFSTDLKHAVVKNTTRTHEIAKLFIKHKIPYTPAVPPSTPVSKVYSGILIDARGFLPVHGEYVKEKLRPCIFPKIWDTEMSQIYEKNMVDPALALNKSIAVYSSTLDESAYRDRIGTTPLRILARGVFGQNRTDPIISAEDSGQILSRPENLKLLKEGKIVIICDPEVLRITEPFTPPDENYYFAYRDIERLLKENKPQGLELSNPDNVIKITLQDIHFIADQADILPSELGKIDIIAEALLKTGPYTTFLIEGHTADLNKPDDQQILSVQRAEKIAEELSKRGIARRRFTTTGYGSTQPIAPSDTPENRARNRRVEISVIRE